MRDLYKAVPVGVRPSILLGAHAGLRLDEAAGLPPEDVDFLVASSTRRSSGRTTR